MSDENTFQTIDSKSSMSSLSTTDTINVCSLCLTTECLQSTGADIEAQHQKRTIGALTAVPNEIIVIILRKLSLKDLSQLSVTNKWFRDFIVEYFIKSKTGFVALIGGQWAAIGSTPDHEMKKVRFGQQIGLLLKRLTCLFPTEIRIQILVQVLNRLDGIPSPTHVSKDSLSMRSVFHCYGQLIHRLISGWDDSEVQFVLQVLQSITHMEQHITSALNTPSGARQSVEFFIRQFYRLVWLEPTRKDSQGRCRCNNDFIYLLKQILNPYSLINRAKLLIIIFGPMVAVSQLPSAVPYIGWWELTDTFFIKLGLQDLGYALSVLYGQQSSAEDHRYVIYLFEAIIRLPQNWLPENKMALLFHCGPDIIYQCLLAKIEKKEYKDLAERLVYLSLVTHMLTKSTQPVLGLIQRLASVGETDELCGELVLAYSQAFNDIETVIDMEDERDVTETQDLISAQTDLLKCLLFAHFPPSVESIEAGVEPMDSQIKVDFVPDLDLKKEL